MTDEKVEPWWSSTIVSEYEIARGDLAKDGKPKGYSICPTKSIKASANDCYDAFATARALDAWFGPKHDLDCARVATGAMPTAIAPRSGR